jgi:hypothetical protein
VTPEDQHNIFLYVVLKFVVIGKKIFEKKKMEHYENIGTKEEEKKTRAASKEV